MLRLKSRIRWLGFVALFLTVGCWQGSDVPAPQPPTTNTTDLGTWDQRTPFIRVCEGARSSILPDPALLGKDWTKDDLLPQLLLGLEVEFGQFDGGWDVQLKQAATRRCEVPVTAEVLLRQLHTELRRLAKEKGCQLEGPEELPKHEKQTHFKFTYQQAGRRGEVTGRVEPAPNAADPKACSVMFRVKEGPRPTP